VEYVDEELDWELDAEEDEHPMRPSRSPQTRTSGSMGPNLPPSVGNVVPEAPRGLDFERWAFGPENGIGSLRPLALVSDDEQQPTLAERRPSTQDHAVQIELGTSDAGVRHVVRDVNVVLQVIQRQGELDTRVERAKGTISTSIPPEGVFKELDRSGKCYVTDSDRWHQ